MSAVLSTESPIQMNDRYLMDTPEEAELSQNSQRTKRISVENTPLCLSKKRKPESRLESRGAEIKLCNCVVLGWPTSEPSRT